MKKKKKEELFKKIEIETRNSGENINIAVTIPDGLVRVYPEKKYSIIPGILAASYLTRTIPKTEFSIEEERKLLRNILITDEEADRRRRKELNIKNYTGI